MKEVKITIEKISELIIDHNKDLKHGITNELQNKVNLVFVKYQKDMINYVNIVKSPKYGYNFELVGIFLPFYFHLFFIVIIFESRF